MPTMTRMWIQSGEKLGKGNGERNYQSGQRARDGGTKLIRPLTTRNQKTEIQAPASESSQGIVGAEDLGKRQTGPRT